MATLKQPRIVPRSKSDSLSLSRDEDSRSDVLMMIENRHLRGSYARSALLAKQLIAQHVGVQLVCTQSSREADFGIAKVRVSRHLTSRVFGGIARRCLAADLEKSVPALIDVQQRNLHCIGSSLARRLKRPYVVTVCDYLQDREQFLFDRLYCRYVVAVSDSVKSELLTRTRLKEEQVVVIPSGVLPPADSELRPIFVEDRAPVIGTAGALESQKGLNHFLKAAARVLEKRPDAMFVIAGSGPEERRLRRMAVELGISHAVTINTNLTNFRTALRAMDLFVLPSLKQGLGSIMLNAMASALPVIATESGGVFSVVQDGVTGLLVPPADESMMVDQILHLLSNPDQAVQLGLAARQRIIERFHLDQMVSATLDLYQRVLAESV
ncbi:glycosyltransferase family 4 protein [Planctomicrobium sp. SH668]|uniref:glycosyltransferase family 4 protein n=1 Tax=Planctomicrobium sp. SH668 TaxID=3448126 RepID=UPI003F5CB6A9